MISATTDYTITDPFSQHCSSLYLQFFYANSYQLILELFIASDFSSYITTILGFSATSPLPSTDHTTQNANQSGVHIVSC